MASEREELSHLTAATFNAGGELKRLDRVLDKIEKGVLDEEVLEECPPEFVQAKAKNDKLKYRKLILERSLNGQMEANAKNNAQPPKMASSGDGTMTKAVDAPSEDALRRYELITRNLQEVIGSGADKLMQQLSAGKNIHVYWGTATTGRPHVGYLVPMRKIADFLQAGIKVTVLFADLHAFLDNMKSTWELLENRVKYYEASIKALLQSLHVPIEQLHFIRGSTYQLGRPYTEDILRLCTQVSQRDALKAGAEVVKQVESPLLSGLLYPLLQALDEQYLKVDGQFGGVDQRKIFVLAEEQLPKLKLGKRWHLMNPMVPGLTGGKMSSSEANSKIDLLDPAALVTSKISGAECIRGSAENGVLSFYEHVLMPIVAPDAVTISGKQFTSHAEIKAAFDSGVIDEAHLKEALTSFLIELLAKVQSRCDTPEVSEALVKGYEPVPERKVELPARPEVSLPENRKKQLDAYLERVTVVADDSSSLALSLQEDRVPHVIIPIAPKGRFHLGFMAPLLKIRSLVRSGVPVRATVLVSSLEAFLDSEKCPWNAREPRADYFAALLSAFATVLGIGEHVKVLRDVDMDGYLTNDYALDLYKLASAVTRDESSVLASASSALSCSLVPLVYALNAKYTKADAIIVGADSLPIAELAVKLLQSLGVHAPTQLAVEEVPGMDEQKINSSLPDFQLDPFDTPKQTKTKIGRTFCEQQNVTRNVALELARLVVFPLLDGQPLSIGRDANNGGNVSCATHADLVREFATGSNPAFPLHPSDLKPAVVAQINALFDPIRQQFADTQTKMLAAAFPKVQGKKK